MKKLTSYRILALLLALPLLLGSCKKKSDFKPLSQLKKEQTRAIEQLINKEHFGGLIQNINQEALPAETDSRYFYMLANGLYVRVKNRGDMTRRARLGETTVSIEMTGRLFREDEPELLSFSSITNPAYQPTRFRYMTNYSGGIETHYTLLGQVPFASSLDRFMCEGIAYPVSYIGDGAELELIIPFELGPSESYVQGRSIYLSKIIYKYL